MSVDALYMSNMTGLGNMPQTLPSNIQANTAHIQFGKYTLFSAYASTANVNMSPIAFAILFGGETTKNWGYLFWKFTVKTHPSINRPVVTFIRDQNLGCIATLAKHLPQAHHFLCW